jgi:uncharacterized protein involved in outer membrane biogenesis
MRPILPRPTLPTLKRLALRALLVTTLYAFCGFLLVPLIVKPILKSQLQQALHRQVSVAKLATNPFTLSVRIKKLKIDDLIPGRPLFAWDELFIDLELSSLLKFCPVLREVTLTGPALSLIRIKGQDLNLSDLIATPPRAEAPETPTAQPRFVIKAMAIHQGRVAFSDLAVNQEQVVEAIEVQVPFLSSLETDREAVATAAISALVNGAALTVSGEGRPFAPQASNRLHLTLKDGDLRGCAPYLPTGLGVKLCAGRANTTLELAVTPGGAGVENGMTLSGRVALNGVELTEADGEPLLTIPALTVAMAPSAILRRELHLTEVALAQPVIALRRNADHTTNLDTLLAKPVANGPQPAVATEEERPLQLTADKITIFAAKVAISDQGGGAPFSTVLEPVNLSLSLSRLFTSGEGGADYGLTLTTESGEGLALQGGGTLFPLRSAGNLELTGISLSKYRPYVDDLVNFTLDAATVDLATAFELDQGGPQPSLLLSDLGLAVRDLALRRGEESPFVHIPSFSLEQGRLDLAGRAITLGQVKSQGGRIVGQRAADGTLDLGELVRQTPGRQAQASAPPWAVAVEAFTFSDYALSFTDGAHPKPLALTVGKLALHGQGLKSLEAGVTVKGVGCDLAALAVGPVQGAPFLTIPALAVAGVAVDQPGRAVTIDRITTQGGKLACQRQQGGSLDLAHLPAPASVAGERRGAATTPAWALKLGTLALSDFALAFTDKTLAQPLALSLGSINLTAQDLSTRSGERAQLAGEFTLADQGHISLSGQVGQAPLDVDLSLKARGIPVATFEPYWGERLKMRVAKGAFAGEGRLSVRGQKDKPPAVRYQGSASLVDFLAVDGRRQKLLAWNALTAAGLDLATMPMRCTIKEVGLTDYFLSLVLNPAGELNLRELVVEEGRQGAPAAVRQAPGPGPDAEPAPDKHIAINRVTLQGGVIDFRDQHVTPNFTTKLLEMTGRISGLDTAQDARAEVDLFGKLANRAPISITGTMNPLAPELFVDLKGSIKDVELSSLTPYAGRYVGYTIRKGKLYLDTSYSIIGTTIDSRHTFLLDQFILGDEVESSEAIKAPVKLAVALLKNRKGEIHLELPIKGDLSHPDFQIGAIAGKMFMGLITKAITAPFALLGALFGGEELRVAEFAPGSSAILPETGKRLASLAQALYDRPALTLEIKGYASQDQDHEALVRQRYAQLLLAGDEGELAGAEKGVERVAAMTPEEVEKRLARAYQQADFPKPRNIVGLTKRLPPEEMKKLLLSHIEVSGDDLLLLADERAQVVTAYLAASGKVEPQRCSRLEPGVEPTKGEGKLTGSRVDFSLR